MGDQAIKLVDERKSTSTGPSEEGPTLEVLFNEHHQRVFLAAYRISGSTEDAEDVLQSIFLRLLKRSEHHNIEANPASYLCRAAINASLDIIRKKNRYPTVKLEDSRNEADPLASPADIDVRRNERRRYLRAALSRLGDRAAEIFALRYFEDFGNAEIAEMLGTSSSTVAVTLHRTRDRLQELLREFEGENQ